MTSALRFLASALAVLLLLTPTTRARAQTESEDEAPRVVVTAMAGAGNEFVLRGLAEVRVVDRVYVGAGYVGSIHMPDFFYHGPALRVGYRAPLGTLAAVTPRVGVDVPLVAGRGGDTEYKELTGHFPLVAALGGMIAIYPSVLVVGLEANLTIAGVTEDGSCTYVDTGDCSTGGPTQGHPSSRALVGAHGGLVLGLAF